VIETVPEQWAKCGVTKKDMKKIKDHLEAIKILREHCLNGPSVIRAYHLRRVAPLMARALPLHRMLPMMPLGGMVLAEGPLVFSEIAQHIKDMMGSQKDSVGSTLEYMFPVPGCPPMRLEPDFIMFVSFPFPHSLPLADFSVLPA
jgi:hypothetical protein